MQTRGGGGRKSGLFANVVSERPLIFFRGEEPTCTNMDISTGHMVLAYMEDHLKNKQRLEQEWVGLCSYEAEPCATTTAFKVFTYLKLEKNTKCLVMG